MRLRHSIHSVLAVVLLIWIGGCAKHEPAAKPAPTPFPQPVAKLMPAPTPAVHPATKPASKPKPKLPPAPVPEPVPTPEVLFSLRGPEGGRLANDRPLFVAVRVESSVDKEAALCLAPAKGRWSDALSVELVSAGSPEKALLQAQRADGADEAAAATLGTGQAAEGTWLFSSAGIAKLTPGDYRVQVKLSVADGAGWRGTAAGEPVSVTLYTAGGSATPEQQVQQALAWAAEAMAAKNWPKAAQLLDERLAADPDNIDLLKTRAVLCLEGKNLLAANVCVNRAWARVMREKWTHPPADLYALSQAVMAAFSQPPAATAGEPPPAWTMPPAGVLAPLPHPEAAKAQKQ
ncbi:MAG: hypothetical protein ABI273_05020 [Lacunisphaera sp.]